MDEWCACSPSMLVPRVVIEQWFLVAIGDDDKGTDAVAKSANAADAIFEIVGHIPATTLASWGMTEGEVRLVLPGEPISRLRSALATLFNADDQTGEVRATLLLQVGHRVSAFLPHENEVVAIKGISLTLPLAIRRGRRVDMLREGIGKIELAGDHVAVVDERLEVYVGSAAWIPPGIDRIEAHLPVSPGELRSAQEGLALCRTSLLARVTGIEP